MILDPTQLTLVLFLAALVSLLVVIMRPTMTKERGGRMLAFLVIFIIPIIALQIGANLHLEHSKSTQFCLGCHEMRDYGKSLEVDDEEFLPALHYQYGRVPQDKACYTCHTDYTMYGDVTAKMRGLQHVIVHYFSVPPEKIELYRPYNNRECLHCHGEARGFLGESAHSEEDTTLTSLLQNRTSCLESGCHDVAHNVGEIHDYEFWSPRAYKEKLLSRSAEEVGSSDEVESPDEGSGEGGSDSKDSDTTDTETEE